MQTGVGTSESASLVEGSSFAIETKELTKRFGDRAVVDRVSLQVETGSIYGFLGPNGSGKTTTIRMLLGLVFPDSGQVSILGADELVQRRLKLSKVGAVVEGPGFYPYLSGMENLRRFAQVSYKAQQRLDPGTRNLSKDDIAAALEKVGLLDAMNKRFKAYSLGMKQRLAIAAALLWPRDLLVLDEPTNGLDPQGIVEVRTLLTDLREQGMTIFVSSHILSEVEILCSHIAVMRDGGLLFQGSTSDFSGSLGDQFVMATSTPELARSVLVTTGFAEPDSITVADGRVSAKLTTDDIERVVAALVNGGVGISAVGKSRHSLEEAFVELTGRSSHAR